MSEHERLPHLSPFEHQPIVFLTTVTFDRRAILACEIAHDILRTLWSRAPTIDGWTVGRYVLMPDHIHLFARASHDAKPLAQWMQSWKSLSSRRLTAGLRVASPIWQRDYFDRFLCSADNYREKWNYVAENPVRKGLVQATAEWRWQGVLEDLSF